MIISISWRNVWRNRRRSLVIIASTILGVGAGIFMLSFMYGWVDQRIHDSIHTEYSSIQIHDSMFKETEDVNRFMSDLGPKLERLREIEGVQTVSSQLVINSMLKIAQANLGGKITGIDPQAKAQSSDLPSKIIYGSWFETNKANTIVMSSRTAKRLGIIVYQLDRQGIDSLKLLGVPDEILAKLDTFTESPALMRLNDYQFSKNLKKILGQEAEKRWTDLIVAQAYHVRDRVKINVMVQDTSGNFHEESFSLGGLFKTANSAFDEMNVFVNRTDLERMTGLGPDDAHEICILLKDDDLLLESQAKVRSVFPDKKVETWKEIDPIARYYSESMEPYLYIFMGVILLALFFGIVNTMLMAVLERVKEIGMLKAIGMNSRKVFKMIVLESSFLTLTGSVVGIGVGVMLNAIFSVHPINLGVFGEGLEDFGFNPVVYTSIGVNDIIIVAVLCIITGILASLAPAIKAVRLKPVDAIRID